MTPLINLNYFFFINVKKVVVAHTGRDVIFLYTSIELFFREYKITFAYFIC